MEDYADKVAGGWLGQAIAVLWGQWTEGKWQGEMIPFDFDDWSMFDDKYGQEVYLSVDTAYAKETGDWSEYLEKMMKYYRCERCGHEWIPRRASRRLPAVCPSCKNPNWNIPKQPKRKKASK